MSVDSKMTAIADEIRVLTGGTSALSLDAMATDLEDTNEELDTQAELIEDIMGLLEGKAIDSSALQSKTVTPTKSQQIVRPDGNYQGLSQVTVEAISDDYIQPEGTRNITQNGTFDVTEYASVAVNVAGVTPETPTAGDYPVVENASLGRISETSLTSTGISITIPVTGTYRLKWSAFRSSTGGTNSTRLYRRRNGQTSAIGTEITSWTNSYYINGSLDVQLNAGDEILVYARSRGSNYYVCAGNLSACVAQPHILVD